MDACHSSHDQVAALLGRVVHGQLDAGFDAGSHHQHAGAGELFSRQLHRIGYRRNHRGKDAAQDLGGLYLMEIQHFPHDGGVFQGCGFLLRGKTFQKEKLVFMKTAHDNIRISDIDGKNHVFLLNPFRKPVAAGTSGCNIGLVPVNQARLQKREAHRSGDNR